ncbi:hypothetical protein EYF80_037513 [Liparis tanakae]|uniref:Uncharacterized protein n=1 Tax=Liparis tanakae TaxID=230148 RepID=A0A4Z2GFI0_9TELE|nr:hypothetical protein EYF80_037513 [Liparis tanakae]
MWLCEPRFGSDNSSSIRWFWTSDVYQAAAARTDTPTLLWFEKKKQPRSPSCESSHLKRVLKSPNTTRRPPKLRVLPSEPHCRPELAQVGLGDAVVRLQSERSEVIGFGFSQLPVEVEDRPQWGSTAALKWVETKTQRAAARCRGGPLSHGDINTGKVSSVQSRALPAYLSPTLARSSRGTAGQMWSMLASTIKEHMA